MTNAIILAAGKSERFAPFTFEKPKGLFKVRGEYLIERQIKQLKEANINEIMIVVGFMKEKFFYLEEKYGVKLVVNNTFDSKGNLYSLYTAREYLADTYVCSQDHYFIENPFLKNENHSYRACKWQSEKIKDFSVTVSNEAVITGFEIGGQEKYAMIGQAFFTETFSKTMVDLMEEEIDNFGVSDMFWEEFYGKHQEKMTLYAKLYEENQIQEFDSLEDLRQFDQGFLNNIDSNIVQNICSQLRCIPNEITNIDIIEKGLTNVSFKFSVNNTEYVYRHPGGTAGNLVDRKSELFAQYKAIELEIDKSVIYMDPTGWKLSYYVQNMIPCDLDSNNEQLDMAMSYLRKLHNAEWDESVKRFNPLKEALKLIEIASPSKGDLFNEFSDFIRKIKLIDYYLENDGYRELALCHNDVYAPNYLVTEQKDMYLIDWEYAGVNDKANDVACICSRYDFSDEQIERHLKAYFGRELTFEEHRHYIASIALSSFYWFSWGLYKGSVNDDDGFFFLPAYRNLKRFVDLALASYENGGK